MIKVLIVDDHALIQKGLSKLLETDSSIKVMGVAASGEQAIRLVREQQPDVILMDIHMPGMGGLGATRRIHHLNSHIKILVLTAYEQDPFPAQLLQAGAQGYLTKGCNAEEIVRAIHSVYSGQNYLSHNIANRLALKNSNDATSSPFDNLSNRELEILLMIVHGEQPKKIATQLCLSIKTIHSYRYRLFSKLNVKTDVELTRLALQYGILTDDKINL
jgi:two-component system invasion response regulator UvrY